MLVVGISRVILTILKTLDGFSIALWHLCQPLNYVPGRSAFNWISLRYVNLSTSPMCGLSWTETWNCSQNGSQFRIVPSKVRTSVCRRLTPPFIGIPISSNLHVDPFFDCSVKRAMASHKSNKIPSISDTLWTRSLISSRENISSLSPCSFPSRLLILFR